VTTYAERLTKIGLVVADEWTTIVKLKPSCSAIFICWHVLSQNYWTNQHQNITQYSGISDAIKSCIYKALTHSISEWHSNKVDWSGKNADFSTLIGCHGNVP